MDKIKAFFQNKITKIVSWILLVITSTILIVSGVTAESLSSAISLVAGVIAACSTLIAFISTHLKK